MSRDTYLGGLDCSFETHVVLFFSREEGCIYYDIHVREGEEKSNRLYFIEHWRSQSDLDAHMNTDHVREFRAKTAAAVASVDFGKFKRIAH